MRLLNTTTLLLGLVILAGVAGTCVICRKAANDGRTTETQSAAGALATMTALTERMCACTTKACADEVVGAMNAWSSANADSAPVKRPTETEMQALQEIGTRYGECLAIAMNPKEAERPVSSRLPPNNVGTHGGPPNECQEYGVAIKALASCAKFPQVTRDALLESYAQAEAAWANVPEDGRAALAVACGQARDAVRQSAAACQ